MANSQETNVNLKINRVPDKATLEDMVANNQLQPNQLYMLPSELGSGVVTMQTKVLWTNPSPTSSFAGQSITTSENLFKFNYIAILVKDRATNYLGSDVILCKLENGNNLLWVVGSAGGTTKLNRYAIINSTYNTTITFEPCYSEDLTQYNAHLIPYQIIGIKLIESLTQITNKYSTDETVVGEWIDGKKIYRKVFEFESTLTISNTTWTDTNINQTSYNIETLTNCRALNDKNVFPMNLAANVESSTNIYLLASRASGSFPINKLILEYTKTTD